MSKIVSTDKAPSAIGPYSQAKWAGNTLFISGQIPLNPTTMDIVDGIEPATHQVMKNLEAILTEAGLSFKDVVKTTIFLKNMDDFSVMNEVYASYLEDGFYPARETVEVSCLPRNVDVEISMIAYKTL